MAAQLPSANQTPTLSNQQNVDSAHNLPLSAGRASERSHKNSRSCAYRELNTGIECGCQKFWRTGNDYSQCACGHHECFHSASPSQAEPSNASSSLPSDINAALLERLGQLSQILAKLVPSGDAATNIEADHPGLNITAQQRVGGSEFVAQTISRAAANQSPVPGQYITQSTISTSYQPRLPSACQVPEQLLAPTNHLQVQNSDGQPISSTADARVTGLGLWLNDVAAASEMDAIPGSTQGQRDNSSTRSSELYRALQVLNAPIGSVPSDIPSTKPQSLVTGAETSQKNQLLPAIDVGNRWSTPIFDDLLQSATELATPSIDGRTPDLNIPAAVFRQSSENNAQLVKQPSPRLMRPPAGPRNFNGGQNTVSRSVVSSSSQILSPPALLSHDVQSLRDLANHVQSLRKFLSNHGSHIRGLGDRLDAMERTSIFSQIPRDQDTIDKLEMIETRILEIEGKVEDIQASGSYDHSESQVGPTHKRHDQLLENGSDGSSPSSNSGISSALILAGDANAVKGRIDSLDERVTGLEKALPPSLSRPYEMEVVFIPWGRELRGLWVAAQDTLGSRATPSALAQDTEEWTVAEGLRSSSRASASLRSGADSGWSSQAIHEWADHADAWLVPRACGIKSVIYHRLRSRGFVKTVELTKSGAREIQQSIAKAFEDVLAAVTNHSSKIDDTDAMEEIEESLWGLNAPFIPLRKIHRSSRLRFLAKSEMVTPTVWTSEFLSSSVLMHAAGGLKRLFITHKEAYQQPSDSDYPSWTWQQLRQLPKPSLEDSQEEEGNARETCWADHSVLDAPPLSVNTSFASNASSGSQRPQANDKSHSQNNDLPVGEHEPKVKSESNSGFESEALLISKDKGPITPITDQNYSTQDAIRSILQQPSEWHEPSSEDDIHPPSTPHPNPANFQTPYNASQHSRYNFRRHTRTLSNPLEAAAPIQPTSSNPRATTRLSQRAPAKRITRSFSTPSNPLINTLPTFVHSSPNLPRRPTAGSSGNKRRRVDRSVSAEEYMSSKARRSRSASIVTFAARGGTGSKKGKRSVTPVGPYLTPYSGNFASGYFVAGSVRDEGGESEWEGVVDDEHEHDTGTKKHTTVADDMNLEDEDILMNTDDEDEDEEEEVSPFMDDAGFE
ncbi:hypothetical protein BT63DRAFT_91524 [Microthyrium microscopicum]|uniref:Uncharacterized protein n=1 Tax=Microthyrium microscopicum TaxID=703497 RepID=A0A6A6TYX9_9PEZI|nr:hypothetical protein BT63DRAFT_91524 [Microthyrium microscopicum]